jgi:hypothetical protein
MFSSINLYVLVINLFVQLNLYVLVINLFVQLKLFISNFYFKSLHMVSELLFEIWA